MLDTLLNFNFLSVLTIAIPLIFGMVVHEVSHGYTAYRLGDPTSKMLGRLTLNPIKHIDPFASILLPMLIYILSNGTMIFGGAKPIPVQTNNLRNRINDMSFIALAGPLSNIVMAIMWMTYLAIFCVMLRLFLEPESFVSLVSHSIYYFSMTNMTDAPFIAFFIHLCLQGISINLLLAIFNMIPIPPLDGSRVLVRFLPPDIAMFFHRIEPWGIFILILLISLNLFSILGPIINFFRFPMISWAIGSI